jgi:hypothetical protein
VLINFLNHSGVITVVVTDPKFRHSEIAGGLEILADYILSGNIKLVCKGKKVLADKLERRDLYPV